VLFHDAVLSSISNRSARQIEQGGLLLGLRKAGAIEVTNLTLPSRWDVGSSNLFKRSARGHRVAALREWLRSGEKVDWVGEWHTHPGGTAVPSQTDVTNWRMLSRHTAKDMTFVISAPGGLYVGLQVKEQWQVRQLRLLETSSEAHLYGTS
jgi:integrative and conjugative element protein (TIGR02256 family)